MTDVTGRSRVDKGVPTGGQFATEPKADASDLLTGSPATPLPEQIAGYFAPYDPAETPVEYGTFYVGDKFYVEVERGDATNGPLARFYDKRYPMHGEEGQFISSYYVSTLREPKVGNGGLALDGGVREWTLSPTEFDACREELKRRAPSYDGLAHSLNPDVWSQMYDYEREDLVADLTSRPFADSDGTTGDLIAEHGASVGWRQGSNVIILGDGRTFDGTYALKAALDTNSNAWLYRS